MFPVKAVAFVFDLNGRAGRGGRTHLQGVKDLVIDQVQHTESDDEIYVYSPDGDLTMIESVGAAVAAVAEYRYRPFSVPVALRESVWLTGQTGHAHRAVFLFTNQCRGRDVVGVAAASQFAQDEGFDCDLFVYGIGFGFDDALAEVGRGDPRVTFRHAPDPADLAAGFATDFSDLIVPR
jgi:hypothetical protein